MNRDFYLDLARRDVRMPIGTDLALHEMADPEAARRDGAALTQAIERAARWWQTPLALPLMDLRLEKFDLLSILGVPESEAEAFHFRSPLDENTLGKVCDPQNGSFCPGSKARNEALASIGTRSDHVPVGMAIGPFSLATRLMADPIAAAGLAGSGESPEDSDDVKLLFQCLRIAEAAVMRSVVGQIAHGARAIVVCEPAACKAYLSPRQMKAGSSIFEQLVMEPNLRIKSRLDQARCDLIFHDCGELIDSMVEAFAQRLHPVILSLGSSRKLWEDARLVPADVVLYGNLPTKSFYSDGAMPLSEVISRTENLVENMRACGHPHILGSECDVLFVPESKDTILAKVEAMMRAGKGIPAGQ